MYSKVWLCQTFEKKNIRERNHGDVSWQSAHDRIINLSGQLLGTDVSDQRIDNCELRNGLAGAIAT
ncbi:MAG: hypothetical protein DCF19_18695 [Pseudanabaena frigida]|uniref:Uncharacterized protein n=1 Tax=Pseudanabaena frigida TaxID=945775 RepID=A0A2W4VYU9_9CYAN|nr:MAG: hypothetical protein DCF19_18695 [Pseudanabaena frigida]